MKSELIVRERQKAAAKLRVERRSDKQDALDPIKNRNGEEYIRQFFGLREIFSYVRSLPEQQREILDIGAGTTKGISDLAKSTLGYGLHFSATTLARNEAIEQNLGWNNTTLTSTEVLRGKKNESIGAILGLYSIDRTFAPHLTAKRLQEILVPGGLVKLVLFSYRKSELPEVLKDEGFEVEVHSLSMNRVADRSDNTGMEFQILLARKPGGENTISLKQLLESDHLSIDQQLEQITL